MGLNLQASLRRLGYEAVRQRGSHGRITAQVSAEHNEEVRQTLVPALEEVRADILHGEVGDGRAVGED